uniref:Uncharacterized protein n=1 Tax=Crocodylus porosus TaxID=8502 RepID=A0A7M4EGB7_CROPO
MKKTHLLVCESHNGYNSSSFNLFFSIKAVWLGFFKNICTNMDWCSSLNTGTYGNNLLSGILHLRKISMSSSTCTKGPCACSILIHDKINTTTFTFLIISHILMAPFILKNLKTPDKLCAPDHCSELVGGKDDKQVNQGCRVLHNDRKEEGEGNFSF